MGKTHDLCVKIGEYQKDGQTKGRYLNIGAIIEKDDGGRYMLLDRTFNPAGLPNPENRNSIVVSMFRREGEDTGSWAHPPVGGTPDDVPF